MRRLSGGQSQWTKAFTRRFSPRRNELECLIRSEKLQSTESHTGAMALKIAFPAISTLLSAYQFRGRLIDCVICVSAGLSPYSLGKSLLPIHAHLCAYAEAFCHVSRSAFLSSIRDASTRAAAIALCADSSHNQTLCLPVCIAILEIDSRLFPGKPQLRCFPLPSGKGAGLLAPR